MAKVSKILTDYRDLFNGFDNIEVFYSLLETDDRKVKEFLSIFDSVEDSRMENKITYTTATVVGIVFLGVLHKMYSWTGIEAFAYEKKDIVEKYVDLSKGIPSHDTLKRVFSLINSETLENALVDFIQRSIEATAKALEIASEEDMRMISMDGKELHGTGRKYNTSEKVRNAQIMHFYDVGTGVCVKSELIEEKTNEIPTAQKVLASLNIKNILITSDAMNCQKNTVKVIKKGNGHYVLGLKENHKDFYNEVIEKFNKTKKFGKNDYYKMETEKNHNQVEIREFYKIKSNEFVFSDEWEGIKNVVMYKKTMTNNITGKESQEFRYYITDLNDIELISTAIRRHWAVENELHWHMDANFDEDADKTMDRRAINNLSIIKKSVLTLLKLMQPILGNRSLRLTQDVFIMNYEINLIKLFTLLDSENIKHLLDNKKQTKDSK